MCQTSLKVLHVLALGMWFGGAGFFNFTVAPTIFDSFKHVVNTAPSDRTAQQSIGNSDGDKDALASALAGSAVGPVFPKYFAMQAFCGLIALVTAASWWTLPGRVHRVRVVVLVLAILTVAAGWPISNYVSELRFLRYDSSSVIATEAKAAFVPWHLTSLFLSMVTVCLAGISLALAAKLPGDKQCAPAAPIEAE